MEKIFPLELENIINNYTQKTTYELYLDSLDKELFHIESSLTSNDYHRIKIDMDCLKDQINHIKPVCIGYEKNRLEQLNRLVLNLENKIRISYMKN